MPIFIGILVLCGIFIVFGTKTEAASVLYYDPPGSEPARRVPGEGVAAIEDVPDQPAAVEQSTQAAPQPDAASIAQSIYNGVDL